MYHTVGDTSPDDTAGSPQNWTIIHLSAVFIHPLLIVKQPHILLIF